MTRARITAALLAMAGAYLVGYWRGCVGSFREGFFRGRKSALGGVASWLDEPTGDDPRPAMQREEVH